MTLAINTADGCGLSNKACHELLHKKTSCISCSFQSKRHFTDYTIITRQSASVMKVVDCVMYVGSEAFKRRLVVPIGATLIKLNASIQSKVSKMKAEKFLKWRVPQLVPFRSGF